MGDRWRQVLGRVGLSRGPDRKKSIVDVTGNYGEFRTFIIDQMEKYSSMGSHIRVRDKGSEVTIHGQTYLYGRRALDLRGTDIKKFIYHGSYGSNPELPGFKAMERIWEAGNDKVQP